jgi:hypothetical protein
MTDFKLSGKWKGAIDEIQNSLLKSEEKLQDQELTKINQNFINQGYPAQLNSPVQFFFNELKGELEPRFVPKQEINKEKSSFSPPNIKEIQDLLGAGTAVPVRNAFLGEKTPEEYKGSTDLQNFSNLTPLLKKIGARAYKFGEQYVDNIPGLSSLGEYSKDDSTGTAGALIQAGGRVLPLAGAFWLGINAGPTSAGTLEEARRKGYIK